MLVLILHWQVYRLWHIVYCKTYSFFKKTLIKSHKSHLMKLYPLSGRNWFLQTYSNPEFPHYFSSFLMMRIFTEFTSPFPPALISRDLLVCIDSHAEDEASCVPSSHGAVSLAGAPSALRLRAERGACAQLTLPGQAPSCPGSTCPGVRGACLHGNYLLSTHLVLGTVAGRGMQAELDTLIPAPWSWPWRSSIGLGGVQGPPFLPFHTGCRETREAAAALRGLRGDDVGGIIGGQEWGTTWQLRGRGHDMKIASV